MCFELGDSFFSFANECIVFEDEVVYVYYEGYSKSTGDHISMLLDSLFNGNNSQI